MKTLVVLLLLAVALGAGHWTAQRPGEGLDAFVDEARRTVARLGDELDDVAGPAVREAIAALPGSTPDPDAADEVAEGLAAGGGDDGTADPGAPPPPVAGAPGGDPARLGGALPTTDLGAVPAAGSGTDPAAIAAVPGTDPVAQPSGPVAAGSSVATPSPAATPAPAAVPGELAGTDADALVSRISALENELTRTMTSSESTVVQGRLDEAERRLVAGEQRLDEALAEIERRVEALVGASGTDTADAADGRLAPVARRLDESGSATRDRPGDLGGRIEALAERLERADTEGRRARAELAAELGALAERTETLDARVGTFASGAADAALSGPASGRVADARGAGDPDVDPADAALSATALRVSALERFTGDGGAAASSGAAAATRAGDASALARVDRRLAALEAKLREDVAAARRVRVLDETLAAVTARLDALAERDARRQEALEVLEASVGDLATTSDALSIDAVQGEVRDEIADLAAEVGSNARAEGADNAALVAALESTRERVAELEERIRELPASSPAAGDAQQTQSALESQIRALGKRIETLPSAPDAALADGLDDVRERVDALSSQGFVTQEELRAQVAGRNVEYKIYFDKNSTEISDEAATVLDSFIAQETNRTAGVSIFGFTDTKGSASYNQQLAQRRAANVRSYLIRNGFDYTKIDNVAGLGEDASAAVLGDEQEDAGQRVVVLFAAQI